MFSRQRERDEATIQEFFQELDSLPLDCSREVSPEVLRRFRSAVERRCPDLTLADMIVLVWLSILTAFVLQTCLPSF